MPVGYFFSEWSNLLRIPHLLREMKAIGELLSLGDTQISPLPPLGLAWAV